MSLSVTKGVLIDHARDLKRAWQATRSHWDDRVAQHFEDEFLEPIGPKLTDAVKAIDSLAAMCRKAETECRDEGG
ncbi:MAG: hypothetical protein AAGI53_04755 [Planctomycetota bacterium]